MIISIIIPTCNRAKRLTELFVDLSGLEIPQKVTWELLLVDNGSRDETSQIIESEVTMGRLPLVHLKEPITGKSRALNKALLRARGDLIIFTDDDIRITPKWLIAYYKASQKYPAVSGFGGKVLPSWEDDKMPYWFSIKGDYALPDSLACLRDMGESEIMFSGNAVPGGLNVALRKEATQIMGLFREDLGPGTFFPYAEDTEYLRRLYDIGGQYMYVPEALLFHINPPERMTKNYILKWTFHCARSEVQILNFAELKKFMGIPRYLFRQAVERILAYFFSVDRNKRFFHQRAFVKSIGEIVGHIQKNHRR